MKIINLLEIVLKGGHGSGNFGHKGRKGFRGGSAQGGGGINAIEFTGVSSIGGVTDLKALKSSIEDICKQLNYDPKKIKYDSNGYTFNLNGVSCAAAATYDNATGEITLYPGFIEAAKAGPNVLGGLLAHEINHHKFNLFEQQLAIQKEKVSKLVKKDKKLGVPLEERFLNSDGTIRREEDKKKFSAYHLDSKIQKARKDIPNMATGRSKMASEAENISNYAEKWWKQAETNPNIQRTAINETLAEVGRLKFENPKARIPAVWEDLYSTLNKL